MNKKYTSEEKEVLSAKISKSAAEGWRNFCAQNGITVTAFLEVAGLELAVEEIPPTVEARRQMIIKAREIDRDRRSRRK